MHSGKRATKYSIKIIQGKIVNSTAFIWKNVLRCNTAQSCLRCKICKQSIYSKEKKQSDFLQG